MRFSLCAVSAAAAAGVALAACGGGPDEEAAETDAFELVRAAGEAVRGRAVRGSVVFEDRMAEAVGLGGSAGDARTAYEFELDGSGGASVVLAPGAEALEGLEEFGGIGLAPSDLQVEQRFVDGVRYVGVAETILDQAELELSELPETADGVVWATSSSPLLLCPPFSVSQQMEESCDPLSGVSRLIELAVSARLGEPGEWGGAEAAVVRLEVPLGDLVPVQDSPSGSDGGGSDGAADDSAGEAQQGGDTGVDESAAASVGSGGDESANPSDGQLGESLQGLADLERFATASEDEFEELYEAHIRSASDPLLLGAEVWIDSDGLVRRLVVDETPLLSIVFDMMLGPMLESLGRDWRDALGQTGDFVLLRTVTEFSEFDIDIAAMEAPPEELVIGDVDSLNLKPDLGTGITVTEAPQSVPAG